MDWCSSGSSGVVRAGLVLDCRSTTAPTFSTVAAGEARDDHVDDSDNTADDGMADGADSVDDSHETATDSAEDALDLWSNAC